MRLAGHIVKIVVCITGASGMLYAKRLLESLSVCKGVDLHLVISEAAGALIRDELSVPAKALEKLAGRCYKNCDLGAPISSGSVKFDAMVVIPASMSTLSKMACGISDNLITRLGAVALKERRRLVLVPRETPLSPIHLENMHRLSLSGAIIMPACPGFYNGPRTLDDLADNMASRVLDLLGVENECAPRYPKKRK
jgi:4-hydroxy-3-polyprenylbenzoate decarboxylase